MISKMGTGRVLHGRDSSLGSFEVLYGRSLGNIRSVHEVFFSASVLHVFEVVSVVFFVYHTYLGTPCDLPQDS